MQASAATPALIHGCHLSQVLLLDELTTFLDGEDQRGVLEAVRACVGGPDQVHRWCRRVGVYRLLAGNLKRVKWG